MESIVQVLGEDLWALTTGLFGAAGLRFALGSYAALSDGTFVLSSFAAFVRSQILGRVFPILTVAYFAYSSGNVALIAATGVAAAAFTAETLGAVQEALSNTTKEVVAAKTVYGEQIGNSVPQD